MDRRKTAKNRVTVVHERSVLSGISQVRQTRVPPPAPPEPPPKPPSLPKVTALPEPSKKKNTLTLTQAKFEYLRQLDVDERKKRLDTWLDIDTAEKLTKRRFRSFLPGGETGSSAPKAESTLRETEAQKLEQWMKTPEGKAMKHELEKVAKVRIRDLQQEPVQSEILRRLQTTAFKMARMGATQADAKGNKASTSTSKSDKHKHHHHHKHKKLQETLEQISKQLESVPDKKRSAELRKTYGKGWGNKKIRSGDDTRNSADSTISLQPSIITITAPTVSNSHRSKGLMRTTRKRHQEESTGPTILPKLAEESSSSSSSPIDSKDSPASVTRRQLFRAIEYKPPTDMKMEEDEDEESSSESDEQQYERPEGLAEFQETCFGNIRFIEKSDLQPVADDNKGFEFYMSLGDTALGIGMGRAKHFKVNFFKPGGPQISHVAKRKVSKPDSVAGKRGIRSLGSMSELATDEETRKRLSSLDKTLLNTKGVNGGYRLTVEETQDPHLRASKGRIPRGAQFTRPPRRIWYTPLPLADKKYYRTNWKRIKFDIRQTMKAKNYWPKLWINFEENHPKKLFELIHAKLAVKQFDKLGFKKTYDWGRGIHPDYIDWVLEDVVPHPGMYYHEGTHSPVRRASVEEEDFKLKDWFVKPPRYIPQTPISPPFDVYDFCGYGNRKKPFFLAFTVPREILHYYSPPSRIDQFFRQIPKPPYAFPGYTFKRWLKYPLEQKLPQYYPFPKRFMSWTRGKIGDPIQCSSTEFKLDDPLLLKRDSSYNVYHDPHVRRYILRKDVLDKIWELGIINSKGEVKCSLLEFNKNRKYLRDYEWLDECVRRWNVQWTDRQQHNRLTKDTNYDNLDWESKKKEWYHRLERCRIYTQAKEKAEQNKYKQIREKYERTLQNALDQRERVHQEMTERANRKQRSTTMKRKTVHQTQENRLFIFQSNYQRRQMHATLYRRQVYLNRVADKMEKQRVVWHKQMEFHQKKVMEMKEIQAQLEHEYKVRVRSHTKRSHRQWEDVPYAIARNKMKSDRLFRIALKYARIWLDKVRKSKERAPDEKHLSLWSYGHHLKQTIQYLNEESGYVRAGDFFFNLIQLNKQLNLVEGMKNSLDTEMYNDPGEQSSNNEIHEDEGDSQSKMPERIDDYDADDED